MQTACPKWEIKKDTIRLPKLQVNQITQQLPVQSDSLQILRVVTQTDDALAILKHTIMQGWPKTIKQIPPMLHPYWMFKEELTIEDGLILKRTRIIIPNNQCKTILELIHEGTLRLE